ncbi:hypothetical protein [Azospirillum doebereinerae]
MPLPIVVSPDKCCEDAVAACACRANGKAAATANPSPAAITPRRETASFNGFIATSMFIRYRDIRYRDINKLAAS